MGETKDWLRCIDGSHVYDSPVRVGDVCRCGKMTFVIPTDEPMIRRKTTEERLDFLTHEYALLRAQTDKLIEENAAMSEFLKYAFDTDNFALEQETA